MPTPGFEHGGSDLWSSTLLLDHGGALSTIDIQVVKSNPTFHVFVGCFTHKNLEQVNVISLESCTLTL